MRLPIAPFAALFVAAFLLSGPSGVPPSAKAPDVARAESSPAPDALPLVAIEVAQQQPVLRPIAEFFGLPVPDDTEKTLSIVPRDRQPAPNRELKIVQKTTPLATNPPFSLRGIAEAAREQRYEIDFLVALVPDPVESYLALGFDQEVAAIRQAYAESDYYPDRIWIPWKGDDLEKKSYRKAPGVMLFRRSPRASPSPARGKLSVVLLVGETQNSGFHKQALANALDLAAAWNQTTGDYFRKVRILGPYFSGTADPLARALNERGLTPSTCRVVTGSASAESLPQIFAPVADFRPVLLPDGDLLRAAFGFLDSRMGWNFAQAALLFEDDSLYGDVGAPAQESGDTPTSRNRNPWIDQMIRVRLPSGLTGVRNAWEEGTSGHDSDAPLPTPKTVLDFKLGDKSQPVDLVPEFASMTRSSKDLAIANLLASLSRTGIRYVGLLFTDPRDKIYLADRIRKYSPDMVLFTLDNNLLYAHPQLSTALDGTLVIGSFPLFAESRSSRAVLGGPYGDRAFRRQFQSEVEEGIYRATLDLVGVRREAEPLTATWISVVGNGSLWPLARLPQKGERAVTLDFESSSIRSHLQFFYFLLFLGLAMGSSWFLAMRWRRVEDKVLETCGLSYLFTLSAALLALCAGTLVVSGTLPYRTMEGQLLYLAPIAIVLTVLYLQSQEARGPGFRNARGGSRALIVVTLLLLAGLPYFLRHSWMPGGEELFNLRVRRFASGLTPLLPLFFLTGGAWAWLYLETQRKALFLRQKTEWSLCGISIPYLEGGDEIAGEILQRQERCFPSWRVSVWAFGLAGPLFVLCRTVQPIAEIRSYGVLFVLLVAALLGMAMVSFYRFVSLWLRLSRLLKILSRNRSLLGAFERVAERINWKPMKSFGLQLPINNLIILSARTYEELRSRYSAISHLAPAPASLSRYLGCQASRELSGELEARKSLHSSFRNALALLLPSRDVESVQDFLAIRIVCFVRHAFHHLSLSLFSSLVASLCAVLAAQTYAFEPQKFLTLFLWVLIVLAVVVTILAFVSMDRDRVLSVIGQTQIGRITFDWNFLTNVLTYAVIPLLGLLTTQYPMASQHVVSWFNPLLKVMGVS